MQNIPILYESFASAFSDTINEKYVFLMYLIIDFIEIYSFIVWRSP